MQSSEKRMPTVTLVVGMGSKGHTAVDPQGYLSRQHPLLKTTLTTGPVPVDAQG